ncbi:hypothetical protein MOMA_03615 [Moraxella macacae 0408225]|uniref:Bile acid:sodium symporter n=1 Tax=Moraxella macacae 0408225 TaxID=1230338 RepID=L2F8R6_9GAMM|nr:hypothetical protein [Moraxella macacae]ELA09459.1 hypothetical protein MOMA_03615 [Moraxella macacae 0408225]
MLKFIARNSTIFMPLCALFGFLFPQVSNTVLPFLPQILFFLMFFTLLGINQKQLITRLATLPVWLYALFQAGGFCVIVTIIAYLFGAKGDLLLAISALAATAPLFGSGAIVNAVGFDALLAMAKTIAATLIMPLSLLIVLWLLGSPDARVDFAIYFQRLLIYIVAPMLLAVVVRQAVSLENLNKIYPKIAQFNIILLLMFPLGLMGGFRATFDKSPTNALLLMALAWILAFGFYFGAYFLYLKKGKELAIICALVCGGRNVLLTYTIATPFLGAIFLPLIGALQLPMFCLPLIGKIMAKKLHSNNN